MAIEITKEVIENARTYLPVLNKKLLAEQIADWCIEEQKPIDADDRVTPVLWCENRPLRQLFVTGIFARYYLRQDFEAQSITLVDTEGTAKGAMDVDYYMSVEAFDEWGESHVMNQIERLKLNKADKKTSEKCYNILYDYKQFESMVYGAIKDELERRNDVCQRAYALIQNMFSPQATDALIAQLQEQTEKLQNVKFEREQRFEEWRREDEEKNGEMDRAES